MNLDGANETDVREEIAAPLLARLGYERGTENDILRELTLTYGRNFLGRKKTNDPPLRGRADYVLSVNGAGRWVLEIKAPSEAITDDSIDQAISYSRHPEVSAHYAAILNGRRFVMFYNTQSSKDAPIADIEVTSVEELQASLEGTLSPAAIRRDCSPPIVDLGQPLAEGFRSSAAVTGGLIVYSEFEWDCSFPLPDNARQQLDEACRIMGGYRSNVTGGNVWRDDKSRVKAKLEWSVPHEEMVQFVQDKQLMDFEYVSLDAEISTDPENPTVFDVVGNIAIEQGEEIFDILRWTSEMAGLALSMNLRGQAIGHIAANNFVGNFQAEYEMTFPAAPGIVIGMYGAGEFAVQVDAG